MSRTDALTTTDAPCAARAIDCRASAAASPAEVLRALTSRIDEIEFDVLRLEDLAASSPRARALAEAAQREALRLRRRADALKNELELRCAVDGLVEHGTTVGILLDGIANMIRAHDERQAHAAQKKAASDTLRRTLREKGSQQEVFA